MTETYFRQLRWTAVVDTVAMTVTMVGHVHAIQAVYRDGGEHQKVLLDDKNGCAAVLHAGIGVFLLWG